MTYQRTEVLEKITTPKFEEAENPKCHQQALVTLTEVLDSQQEERMDGVSLSKLGAERGLAVHEKFLGAEGLGRPSIVSELSAKTPTDPFMDPE